MSALCHRCGVEIHEDTDKFCGECKSLLLGEAPANAPLYPRLPMKDMTLRDWFAGQALTGFIMRGYGNPEGCAFCAADNMMEKRLKPREGTDREVSQ